MSDQRSTVLVTGDVSQGVAALSEFDAASQASQRAVAAIADAMAQAEAAARQLADEGDRVKTGLDGVGDEAERLAEELARSVAQRRAEAEALEHEGRRLKALGAEQAQIADVQRRAVALRLEAAAMAGREGDAIKHAREEELLLTREVARERKEAAAEAALIEQRRLAFIQEWAAEEKQAARAAKQAAQDREAGWSRAASEAERTRDILVDIDRHTKSAAKSASFLGTSSSSLTAVAGSIGAIVTGIQSAIAMAREAIQLADQLSNEAIEAQNVGANLQLRIGGAREAFKGYVDDVELARIANMAFELGVVETGDELTRLAAGVQAKAEKLGVDSTQLFENAVTAVGRGSALILDNLGIILDQAKAERIYAESLGITVQQLSALQREEAFQKAAMLEIAKAGDHVTKSTDGMAQAWKRGRVEWTNFRKDVLGFEDDAAAVREALRGITREQLELFKFGAMADNSHAAGREMNKILAQWGVTLVDVRGEADRLGLTYEQLIKNLEKGFHEEDRKNLEASQRELAKIDNEIADNLDHQAAVWDVLGTDQSEIIKLQIRSLELRLEAAQATQDEAAALDLTRQLEIARAKQAVEATTKKKTSGRRRDPNEELDRERDATLRLLDARQQVYEAELAFDRNLGEVAKTREYLITLQRQELDVREAAANARKVRGADEIDKLEAERLEIHTERRLLDLEAQELAAAEGKRLADERLAEMDREIELLGALGVATQMLEQQRREAAIEAAALFGTAQDQRQLEHEAQVIRIEEARERRVQERAEQLEAFDRELELEQARGIQRENIAEERIDLEVQVARAEGDHDKVRQLLHQREVARIKREVEARQRALSTTKSLLGEGSAFASLIIDQTIKDEKKRERASMRARGIEALARGALETVEAVAAFARYDFVQGALHTAAAAVAYTQGGFLLAGKVPSGGGAGAAAAGPGGGGGKDFEPVYGDFGKSRDRPSTPASAEELTRLRGGGDVASSKKPDTNTGGTVINISHSTMVSNDSGGLFSDLNDRKQLKNWGK